MKIIFPRMETFQFHGAYDGGSKFVHYLAEELVKKGAEVTIVTTILRDKPEMKEAVHNGVKYIFLPPIYTGEKTVKLNIPYKFVFGYNLMRYLEKTEFDVLHSAEAFAWWYLHKKNRKSVVYQTWAMEAWYGKEVLSHKGIKKLYISLFLKRPWDYVLKKSDLVAADSAFQLPRLKTLGVPQTKIFFIPNGINFKQIQEFKKNKTDRRKELGIKKTDFLVLSVCQIKQDKGVDDIINAFALLKRKIPEAKLLMIGRGVLEPMMHDLFKKNGLTEEKDVFHRKNVPEKILYDYYFSSDIFVSATLSDDFMITIQEGMACGLPIVSSSQPFLVKNDVNGYVVGLNNPKGIADAILKTYKLRAKKRKIMGEKSKEMAEQYDYGNLADIAIEEYKKLISKSK